MVKKILFTFLSSVLLPFFSSLSGVNPFEAAYSPLFISKQHHPTSLFNNPTDKQMKTISFIQSDKYNVSNKKIMVISDVHIMSEKLLKKDGSALQDYLQKDRKLLQESRAIAKEVANKILDEKPELVLVSGDLTKDGELLSHESFVETFKPIIKSGIKMLVIPGNHDIDNPDAVYFNGDVTEKAETITPKQFSEIYHDFGYGSAVSRDVHSLSYVSEPIDGLRVIAIDGCRYYDNKHISKGDEKDHCVTEGRIKTETMRWIKQQADLARTSGKQIIAMVHHNVVEHFDFQGEISAPYLLENFKQVQQDFMDAGIQVVFTGHFHANDIAKTYNADGNYLYDVETGSPVTYPCPYRVIEYRNDNQLMITTHFIKEIDYDLKGENFQAYARRLIKESIPGVLSSLIKEFYPEIKQASNPYSAFIRIPEADKLSQIVEDNLGEIAVNVMMQIYEGNNDSIYDNITLKKLDKSIENIAGELARTRFLKGRIVKSFNNIEYVKKVKVACHSIFYNMKGLNQQVILSGKGDKWMAANREYIDDLNYPIYLQKPQTLLSNIGMNTQGWNDDSRWAESTVTAEAN